MSYLVWALGLALLVSWLPQAGLVLGFVARVRRWRETLIDDAAAPEALVILCLRGGDPFLSRCIAGLVSQDYPNYHVRFVVDHPDDPALPVLKSALAENSFERYEILFLKAPLSTCSLKCSSLAQAIETDWIYDESQPGPRTGREFVALLDADTIPHPTWLRQLASALQKPDVGAATGNRWYIPDQPKLAALVRRSWNAAAIVQMYFYRIAWGGTLALKVSSIRQAELLQRWKLALCEDTMTNHQLSRIGQRLEFVPGLIMVNREDCDFAGLVPWMRRQLFVARLYHPLWFAVVIHGLSSALLLLWGWGMAIALLLMSQWTWAALVVTLMVIYQSLLTALLKPMKSAVDAVIDARGETTQPMLSASVTQFVIAIIATQWVYTYALVTCLLARQVNWRGIEYRAPGPWQIRMLQYKPYQAPDSTSQQSL